MYFEQRVSEQHHNDVVNVQEDFQVETKVKHDRARARQRKTKVETKSDGGGATVETAALSCITSGNVERGIRREGIQADRRQTAAETGDSSQNSLFGFLTRLKGV